MTDLHRVDVSLIGRNFRRRIRVRIGYCVPQIRVWIRSIGMSGHAIVSIQICGVTLIASHRVMAASPDQRHRDRPGRLAVQLDHGPCQRRISPKRCADLHAAAVRLGQAWRRLRRSGNSARRAGRRACRSPAAVVLSQRTGGATAPIALGGDGGGCAGVGVPLDVSKGSWAGVQLTRGARLNYL
jgi:hypothetical protein